MGSSLSKKNVSLSTATVYAAGVNIGQPPTPIARGGPRFVAREEPLASVRRMGGRQLQEVPTNPRLTANETGSEIFS